VLNFLLLNDRITIRAIVLQVPSISQDRDFTSESWGKSWLQYCGWRGSNPRTRSHSHPVCCARLTSI